MAKINSLAGERGFTPKTDPGERIYAIGDIHGRYDLMIDLLRRIEQHMRSLPPAKGVHILFLGDLIDRGPDSREVLDYVHDLQQRSEQVIVLPGNHEDAMLRALDGDLSTLRIWLGVGGAETIRSFGLDVPSADDDLRAFLPKLAAAIPREHVRWLKKLPVTAQSGDYFFCHAGIRPGVALKRQTRTDLLWIREDFLEDATDHGAVIVHGHSISAEVQVRRNRIGIDTGAYRTGALTALYLEDDQREVISTADA